MNRSRRTDGAAFLLDRTVEKYGVHRGQLNPLDRRPTWGGTASASRRRAGTEPANRRRCSAGARQTSRPIATVFAGENEQLFEDLLRLNGSSSWARPKIVAQVSTDKKRMIHGQQELQVGFAHWMIKFPSSQDARDAGAIEYAYSLMAKDAGVEMPKLIFSVRKGRNTSVQNASTGTLMPASTCTALAPDPCRSSHSQPRLRHGFRVTLALTRNIQEAEKVYALACFTFLLISATISEEFFVPLDARNEWNFAPAYDLTFSYGPGGEQSMLVMGREGIPAGPTSGIGQTAWDKEAGDLAKVKTAVANWRRYAEQADVSRKSAKEIADKTELQ